MRRFKSTNCKPRRSRRATGRRALAGLSRRRRGVLASLRRRSMVKASDSCDGLREEIYKEIDAGISHDYSLQNIKRFLANDFEDSWAWKEMLRVSHNKDYDSLEDFLLAVKDGEEFVSLMIEGFKLLAESFMDFEIDSSDGIARPLYDHFGENLESCGIDSFSDLDEDAAYRAIKAEVRRIKKDMARAIEKALSKRDLVSSLAKYMTPYLQGILEEGLRALFSL